jgi:hypothetical protein
MFGSAFGGLYNNDYDPPKDLIVQAECTLEDIYKGGLKTIYYDKIVIMNKNLHTKQKVIKNLVIQIVSK